MEGPLNQHTAQSSCLDISLHPAPHHDTLASKSLKGRAPEHLVAVL